MKDAVANAVADHLLRQVSPDGVVVVIVVGITEISNVS